MKNLMKLGFCFAFICLQLPNAHSQKLYGATAHINITPGKGVPLGGYAGGKRRLIPWDIFRRYRHSKYFKPNTGVRDEIRSKVMVLEKNNEKLLFISLDLIGAIDHFKKDLMPRLSIYNLKPENVFITATHTHSGPGAITYNPFWAMFAMDKFSRKVYNDLMDGIVESISMAINKLEPVKLYSNRFEIDGVQKNRSNKPGNFDNHANLVLLKSIATDKWLGGLFNFAIHPVAFGTNNRKFSADISGAIERKIESNLRTLNNDQTVPTMLFIQAALGDVSPAKRGEEGLETISNHVAKKTLASLSNMKELSPYWEVGQTEVQLSRPGFSLYRCTKNGILGKLFRWSRLYRKLKIGLRRWFPRREKLYSLKLGDILMFTWPGEPTATLGKYLQNVGKNHGYDNTWVLGVTNNHLAYFVTPEEAKEGTREACTMLYHPNVSLRIIDSYDKLLRR